MAFHQILDEILTERQFLSLGKPEKPLMIKSKSYESKNKEIKP
jgi:hypothetical protein